MREAADNVIRCSMELGGNAPFIVFDDARFLDGQYTVWGEVVEGMDNVDALPKGEPPRSPGKILKAEVV